MKINKTIDNAKSLIVLFSKWFAIYLSPWIFPGRIFRFSISLFTQYLKAILFLRQILAVVIYTSKINIEFIIKPNRLSNVKLIFTLGSMF